MVLRVVWWTLKGKRKKPTDGHQRQSSVTYHFLRWITTARSFPFSNCERACIYFVYSESWSSELLLIYSKESGPTECVRVIVSCFLNAGQFCSFPYFIFLFWFHEVDSPFRLDVRAYGQSFYIIKMKINKKGEKRQLLTSAGPRVLPSLTFFNLMIINCWFILTGLYSLRGTQKW